jgi:DNA-binding transcriptional MerR regulator
MMTMEAAKKAGLSVSTLRRWLREGRVQSPKRDRLGWRQFSESDVDRLTKLFKRLHPDGGR